MSESVNLVSPKPGLTVILQPSVVDFNPQTGTRVVEKAKIIRFMNGRASIPADWVDLVKSSDAYNGGIRSPKTIWFEDEALSMEAGSTGPVALRGALSAPTRRVDEPPMADWDSVGARVISDRIEQGKITDLLGAIQWEGEHKKRKTVLRDLAAAMADGGGEAETPDAGDAVPDEFGSEAA